jgi:hypothetical protein
MKRVGTFLGRQAVGAAAQSLIEGNLRFKGPKLMPFRNSFWPCLATMMLAGSNAPADALRKIEAVSHRPAQPISGATVRISAKVPIGATRVSLEYQLVDPGKYIDLKDAAFKTNWVSLAMNKDAKSDVTIAGASIYTVDLPAALQLHRRLVRYRISALDANGASITAPDSDDTQPNFAYFVYDGIPGWKAAIDPNSADPRMRRVTYFETNVMRSVQAYHLLSKASSVENATWREQSGGKEYKYTGTLVFDGQVYDHVRFRARGGVWRYAMGKNMWKFDFNKGHPLQARDDYGHPYRVNWSKLNLRACIQQGDYGHRGEQGMFESVGFRLFRLADVPAPNTHWIQLRIIDEAEENPANQYKGDFWGLYLAIENEDGRFLQEHGLPDGNLYKMEFGTGSLSNHGAGAVTNKSDLDRFISSYSTARPPAAWWRTNLDLPGYYSYRSILECIHHYDVADGKNYDYYLNPKTGRWSVIPWDIDLTWADHMYGGGQEPFKIRVLSHPGFRVEYQNRLREIRDLLFNPDQTGNLIDECAAIIAGPAGGLSIVDADRAKWDYHPVMAMGGKAGQGLFYQASPTHDFRGMAGLMKNYVKTRSAWVDATLLNDSKVPATPTLSEAGSKSASLPVNHLIFHCSEYQGQSAFAAMKWRVGEISQGENDAEVLNSRSSRPDNRRAYEITPVWESAESAVFQPEIVVPFGVVKIGHVYRARARMKDVSGRWSHWSEPVQFAVNPAAN